MAQLQSQGAHQVSVIGYGVSGTGSLGQPLYELSSATYGSIDTTNAALRPTLISLGRKDRGIVLYVTI